MVEIEPNRLHRRLKRALTAKGISQRELGRRIGATQASVSHYVKGKRLPGTVVLYKICKELDVSADWLLGLKRKESDMNDGNWIDDGIVPYRTADDCSLVARIEQAEDGSFELGILEGDTACELFAQRFDSMDAAKKYADGILDQKLQRDKAITLIEDELDGVLSPNLSDEDYLASTSLDRDTMRTLVVRIMPTCTGSRQPGGCRGVLHFRADGIEMKTEQEQAAFDLATDRAVFLSGIWSVYAMPAAAIEAVKGLIAKLEKVYPSLGR